jgi:queuine tRNA-ribosyltransferase
LRWARRSLAAHRAGGGDAALFGIVQGGFETDLRARAAAETVALGFDGYAIGGLSVGETKAEMLRILRHTAPRLPADKPRYLMGVGKPADLVGAVRRGIDMFDCVLPTRSGRTGQAFTRRGTLNIRNARHLEDPRPLDEACACPACCNYSRAYLHHLWRAEEILGQMLLTWHNLHYYQQLMASLRAAIAEARLDAWIAIFASEQAAGDIAPL